MCYCGVPACLQITSHIILKHRDSQIYKWEFAEARISVMKKTESLKSDK